MRYALENGADYIALLNQDARLHPQALEQLLNIFEAKSGLWDCGSDVLFL